MNARRNSVRRVMAGVAVAGAIGLGACGPSESPPMQSQVKQKTETAMQALDDTAITAKVKSALLADDQVKVANVSVETKDGNVMISGKVPDPAQRERVIQIARSVQGVKEVQDSISVN